MIPVYQTTRTFSIAWVLLAVTAVAEFSARVFNHGRFYGKCGQLFKYGKRGAVDAAAVVVS